MSYIWHLRYFKITRKPVRQIKKEVDGAAKAFFQSETVPFCLIISSTESCSVTPGKHQFLQHFRASSVSIAWHDPEAERGSPDSCEGGSEEQICPRIGQSVTVIGQDKTILVLFGLSREDFSLMSGMGRSFLTLPIMRSHNA